MFQGIKKLFGGKKEEGQILAPVAGQGSAFKRGAGSCICPGDTGKRRSHPAFGK